MRGGGGGSDKHDEIVEESKAMRAQGNYFRHRTAECAFSFQLLHSNKQLQGRELALIYLIYLFFIFYFLLFFSFQGNEKDVKWSSRERERERK